jgi:hypothetical protein
LEQHYPTSFYPLPSLDTALVTTTQVLAACFDLLSQVVEDGGVLCWVCLFLSGLFVWWCPLRHAIYQCRFFLYDIAVLLLLFQKKGAFILPSGQKGRVRRRD